MVVSGFGQEPPMPPETPTQPQPWWPTQPRPLPFVHTLFSSNMVLQRDVADPIWGWSTPGDKISISVEGCTSNATAVAGADGKWMTKIGPLAAGGPLSMSIKGGKQSVLLTNVMVGDVWLCSGQSNMNWPVRLSLNGEEEAKQANYPGIRSFTVGFCPSYEPMQVPLPAVWENCTPEHARNFTAMGYFFAREVNKVEKIPIGIIHSSVGATAAEAWISAPGLRKYMPYDFQAQLERLDKETGDPGRDYFQAVEQWAAAVDPLSARQHYTSDPALNTNDWMEVPMPRPWKKAGLTDFDGLVWFRTSVEIPDAMAGKPALLSLSQIASTDITWFNGRLVGASQISGNFRKYEIAGDWVKPGKNLLVVAVMSTHASAGFSGDGRNMALRFTTEDKSIPLAGTWLAKPGAAMKDIQPHFPRPQLGYYKTITGLYNGMIAPLAPFAIKGCVWSQGSANFPFWLQYRRLLPALISDWRERFQVGNFPFLIAQQSTQNEKQTRPVEPGWGEIRESQWRVARSVPNAGLAVTVDIGDEPADPHYKNKQEAGRRLSLLARNLVYGEKDLVYSGPEFTEMMLERKNADPDPATVPTNKPFVKEYRTRLYFKHLGGGLVFKPGNAKPNGFAVAGEDKNFVWADAVIEGDTVVVSAPDVPVPRYVRYGWAFAPIITLFNKDGLPALPFRTDE